MKDDVPRDSAGETHWDRVRNVDAQLRGMEADFLAAAAEWEGEGSPQWPPPPKPPEPDRVEVALSVNADLLDTLTEHWNQWVVMGWYASRSAEFLIKHLVEPTLKTMNDEAAKKGWYGE